LAGVRRIDVKLAGLVEALKAYEPERIILFGSRARGEEDEMSDYDLVVVKRTAKPFLERLKEMVPYIRDFEGAVEVLVYTPEELEGLKDVGLGWVLRREGVTLYERGGG